MIKSMTAFAAAEKTEGPLNASVEIRSYNSRYLDLMLRISPELNPLEDRIKSLINEKVSRGRVEARLQFNVEAEQSVAFEIDQARARAYFEALENLKGQFALASEITLDQVLQAGAIIIPAEVEKDLESYWPVIRDCFSQALDLLEAMRAQEGKHLAGDFEKRLVSIEKNLEMIKEKSGGLLDIYKQRLEERIAALTKGLVEINSERIAQEAALLADRSDISEEIVRSESHVKQFREALDSPEPSGRKLNFLLQEFNREFNTIGSKAQNAEISHIVVDIKAELEKIREQVQNVE